MATAWESGATHPDWHTIKWKPSAEKRDALITAVQADTSVLARSPHVAHRWQTRGNRLVALGYPDIAAGDAYKATLLCVKSLEYLTSPSLIRRNQDTHQLAYRTLLHALKHLHCDHDALVYCREAQNAYPRNRVFKKSLKHLERHKIKTELGFVARKPFFPWTAPQHLCRQPQILELAREEFEANLADESRGFTAACELSKTPLARSAARGEKRKSRFRDAEDAETPDLSKIREDSYGVYAAKDVQAGELLLLDHTVIGYASGAEETINHCANCYADTPHPLYAGCCDAVFCSGTCENLSLNEYHKVMCGKDLSWLRKGDHLQWLLFRCLAMVVQADVHPLDHPLVARLTARSSARPEPFSFIECIVKPLRMLDTFGADFFQPQYDTSVLVTLQTRISTNYWNCGVYKRNQRIRECSGVNPLYSFFNHSCQANGEWNSNNSTTIVVTALEDIKKGEEITIAYVAVHGRDRKR
ncbi:hypothetical protein LTR66_006522 [Elasticomyces elasticus]|nr:hypothetical protein LTR66_006522 [Elasticomyces elasticus]